MLEQVTGSDIVCISSALLIDSTALPPSRPGVCAGKGEGGTVAAEGGRWASQLSTDCSLWTCLKWGGTPVCYPQLQQGTSKLDCMSRGICLAVSTLLCARA